MKAKAFIVFLVFVLPVIIAWFLVYLAFSFMQWSMMPGEWDMTIRYFMAFICMICAPLSIACSTSIMEFFEEPKNP